MNNYPIFKNYNNESNNNIELFDPYNGFIRGNLFTSLYKKYNKEEPYDINPMNDQAKLLTNIDALCFSMTDLGLYLDIYSDNKKAINLYNEYRKELNELMLEYENNYGPLELSSNSLNSYPWSWIDMPWPWDN